MLKKNILKSNLFIVIALLLNLVALISLFTRATDMDEGIIAAHSYYLNETGHVKSPHFYNADFGWEERQYHYHKLTVWIGSGISSIFGFHLMTFRLISYCYYLLFIFVLFQYLKLKNLPKNFFWLFQIIFLINATVFKYAFIYRPEISVMLFGFLSYFLLEKDKKTPSNLLIILAGISAGIATLLHLNGLIFVVSGTIVLLLNRQVLRSILFGAFGGLVSIMYFLDTLSSNSFIAWKEQFIADPNLIRKKASPFLKVMEEHMRFFHSEREIIFSVLLVVSIIIGFGFVRSKFKGVFSYFALLAVSMAFIAHGTTTKYMMLYMPYMVIFVTSALLAVKQKSRIQKTILVSVLSLFLGYHLYVNTELLSKSYPVVKRNAMLAEKIPEQNSLVFANEGFVFDQIKNFTIQSPCSFNFHISTFFPNHSPTVSDLFNFLYEGGTNYVLIDRKIEVSSLYLKIPYNELSIGDTYFNYNVIDANADFILFEKITPIEKI